MHLAKRDIEGAFRILWLDPKDCELFAGELPWDPRALPQPEGDAAVACGNGETAREDRKRDGERRQSRLEGSVEVPGRRGPPVPSLAKEDKCEPTKGLVAIYLVLSFGFAGAPGEWMA